MRRTGVKSFAASLLAAAGLLCTVGCGGSESASGSPSFATMAGVIGCAQSVVWGQVTAAEPVAGRLAVTVEVEEWLVPSTGGRILTFQADDPAREVGAPAWEPAGKVLVIVPERDPAASYGPAEGEQAVEVWRGQGSRQLPDEQCGRQ